MKQRIMTNLQVVVLLLLASGCASVPDNLISTPRVELENIQVAGLGFKRQTFLLSFAASNPNPFPLPVQSFEYAVKLNGTWFASGSTESEITIPADGNVRFAISVDLNLLQTSPQLISVVRSASNKQVRYEIDGQFGLDLPQQMAVGFRNSGYIKMNSSSN